MTDEITGRECPICGNDIGAFRGMRIGTNALAHANMPPKYIQKWNDDIRDCDNLHDKSELID